MHGKTISWIEDLLSERKQCVVLNRKASHWRNDMNGVPQGSVLNLILFMTHVNDIYEGRTCKVAKFADYKNYSCLP